MLANLQMVVAPWLSLGVATVKREMAEQLQVTARCW
jgi:hypothetical protein